VLRVLLLCAYAERGFSSLLCITQHTFRCTRLYPLARVSSTISTSSPFVRSQLGMGVKAPRLTRAHLTSPN
jgi:hypothetical protein